MRNTVFVSPEELPDAASPRLTQLKAFRSRLDTESYNRGDLSRLHSKLRDLTPASWDYDMNLVMTAQKSPRSINEGRDLGTFVGGRITGTLIVWSYKRDRAVCRAAVDAANSPSMLHSGGMNSQLDADLRLNTLRQGIPALRALESK